MAGKWFQKFLLERRLESGWRRLEEGRVPGSVPLLTPETDPGVPPSALGKGLCRQMLLLALRTLLSLKHTLVLNLFLPEINSLGD